MAMKCEAEDCSNEATVHLMEMRADGQKHETHWCESCAAAKGLPGKSHFTIQQLLAGIAAIQATGLTGSQKTRKGKETACPGCGTTLSQFQASGRFGCPECYAAFKDDVMNLVEKIHDSTQHCGKVPRRSPADVALQKDMQQLQVELKKAIKQEKYEEAAALRDLIQKIKDKVAGGNQENMPAIEEGEAEAKAPKAPKKKKPE